MDSKLAPRISESMFVEVIGAVPSGSSALAEPAVSDVPLCFRSAARIDCAVEHCAYRDRCMRLVADWRR